jgi:hypothetical protein
MENNREEDILAEHQNVQNEEDMDQDLFGDEDTREAL